jgi:Flp pilus assembly protein TadD
MVLLIASVALSAAMAAESTKTQKEAAAALSRGDFAEAEVLFKKATQEQPDKPDAWQGLGSSLDAQKKHEQADEAYRRAVELYKKDYEQNPSDPALLYNLALTTACAGDDAKAREYTKQGVEKFPDDKNLMHLNDFFHGTIRKE